MKNKVTKVLITWFILSLVFLVAGQYLGSYFYNRITGHHAELSFFTLINIYRYADPKVVTGFSFVISAIISFLPFIVLTVFLFVAAFKKPKRELHGSAKFANAVDIRKAKLLEKSYEEPDILIGQYKGQYLRWAGKEFCSLAAPTRSGKGVGIVIPNCLHYRDSLVVFDPKLENYRITAGFRKAQGQEVYLFNPSSKEFRSHRWNPLDYVSRDPDETHSDLSEIASILFASANEQDKFWQGMAQQLFIGLGLYLIEKEKESEEIPTIVGILRLAQPKDKELKAWIEEVVKDDTLSQNCKSGLLSFARNSANTMSSILSSMIEPLSVFNDPVVADVTSYSDFDFRDIRKRKMTIYVGIQMADMGRFDRLNNLFFSQLIYQNIRELPEDNKALKYQCLLLMDEFTSLGKMEVLEKGVAYVAGYNIRILLIFQNMAQLNAAYTENGARSLSTNIACQIMYTPADIKDAEEYSKVIGYETYKARSSSKNPGQSGTGRSTSDQQRAVMLPQELMEFPAAECIIKLRGTRTIRANKIIYYKDETFTRRLNPEKYPLPEIPYTPHGMKKKAQEAAEKEKAQQAAQQEAEGTPEVTSETSSLTIKNDVTPSPSKKAEASESLIHESKDIVEETPTAESQDGLADKPVVEEVSESCDLATEKDLKAMEYQLLNLLKGANTNALYLRQLKNAFGDIKKDNSILSDMVTIYRRLQDKDY